MFNRKAIQEARAEQGLTVEELSTAAGVTARQMFRYLAGRHEPPYSVAARIALCLGLDLDSLYVHDGDASRSSQGTPLTKPTPDLLPSGNSRDDGARAGAR